MLTVSLKRASHANSQTTSTPTVYERQVLLTNLISYCDKVTHLVDEGKTVDVVYLDIFDTVSHSILMQKLAARGLEGCTVCWVKNCLEGQAQRVVVNGVKSS